MLKNAYIFDLDGTLVDTEPLNDEHMLVLLHKLGVSPKQTLQNLRGLNAHKTWEILRNEYNLAQTIDELVHQGRQSYLEFLHQQKTIPTMRGSSELLEYLFKHKHPLAIASSANPKRISLLLERTGLEKYFKVIVSGDDVTHSKPAPDSFLLAAQRLAVQPKHCIALEDSVNGIRSAKAAGMYCVAYAENSHDIEQLRLEADYVVSDFTELMKSEPST